jgi:hypothetical protein
MNDPRHFPRIDMTAESPWDPSADTFQDHEEAIRTNLHIDRGHELPSRLISSILTASPDTHFDVHRRSAPSLPVATTTSLHRKGTVRADLLAKRWFIGLETAKRTIELSSQRAVRDFTSTEGSRRLKHTNYQLKYRHLRSAVCTDTMFSKTKSLCNNTCGQIFCFDFHWQAFHPMKTKKDAHLALDKIHRDYSVFHTVIPDNAMEVTGGDFQHVEAYTHNQNLAESVIRDLRRMFQKAMRMTNAPYVLWDHCMELMAEIRSNTALDIPVLDGDTPVTKLTGNTSDISHLCEFGW